MKWLEVGCPYCPAVVTLPSTASGRAISCPDCGKNYLVPAEQSAPQSAEATIELLASEWIEEGRENDISLSVSGELPAGAFEESAAPPAPAATSAAASPVAPPSAAASTPQPAGLPPIEAPASAEPTPAPEVPPPPSPPLPKPAAAASGPWSKEATPAAQRSMADRTMTPEVDVDSPLPPLEILDPPGVRRSRPDAAEPSQTLLAPPPPSRSQFADAGPTPDSAEALMRARRTQLRAIINLGILVGGTLLMIVFAFVVMQISRRRK